MNHSGAGTKRVDMPLLLSVLALVLFGMVMLYSTSSYNGLVKFGDSFYYLKNSFCYQPGTFGHVSCGKY